MPDNTVHPNDFGCYAHLNEVVQEEPLDAVDTETRGLLASIGIVEGKRFDPADRMKQLLTEAVAIGSKNYVLHLPRDVPVNDFWAVTLYGTQTRCMLQTDQKFPTVGSQSEGFQENPDGSCDVYFGPDPPEGTSSNSLQTIPGKSWFVILRMYGPLEPWIAKTWRPGEIELVE